MTLFVVGVLPAVAIEPKPFDYWVLALSWSPQYCAETPRKDETQCGTRKYGFVVHGLWPQNERGYPKNCPTTARLPAPVIERMLPLMPSRGLIQHQWNKHGACTGWPVNEYFDTVEQAWNRVRIPPAYRQPANDLDTTPKELEKQFIQFNPGHTSASLAVQCSKHYFREIRLCLDRQLNPRACGPAVNDRCNTRIVLRPRK